MLFRATPVAYGSSQAQGPIRAAAAVYTTATTTWDLSHICDLYHSSGQCQILNLLSEARDGWILVGFVVAEPHWELP